MIAGALREVVELRHGRSIDRVSRGQIAMAAQLLRGIRPQDGEIEILLHEIARRLEQIVDTGEACRSPPQADGGTRPPVLRLG
jgi:hypothetical protein